MNVMIASHLLRRALQPKRLPPKLLGCGIGDVGWLDIEVRGDENHAPHLYLHGEGERLAKKLGLSDWSVSFSDCGNSGDCFCGGSWKVEKA